VSKRLHRNSLDLSSRFITKPGRRSSRFHNVLIVIPDKK
jgi:hypothetical protein